MRPLVLQRKLIRTPSLLYGALNLTILKGRPELAKSTKVAFK